jgi:DtxR family Mn-dependent transcriptional regulator
MAAQTAAPAGPAVEDYCEAIFELDEDDIDVVQARIAERLAVSRPAVSEMVRRLEADGYLTRDDGIRLTPVGVAFAQRVVRRHRLAERIMTDLLGMSLADAHAEAHKWEHVISPAVETAMDRVLGHPTTCPHGNPIPGSDYKATGACRLSTLEQGTAFTVSRLAESLESDLDLLIYLETGGLVPGRHGTLDARSPDGTLTVGMDGGAVGVGVDAAAQVWVTTAEAPA